MGADAEGKKENGGRKLLLFLVDNLGKILFYLAVVLYFFAYIGLFFNWFGYRK